MNLQTRLRTVLLIDHGVNLLDLSGQLQTFETANQLSQEVGHRYETMVASSAGGLVETSCGQQLMTAQFAAVRTGPIDTLIVVGGYRSENLDVRAGVVAELKMAAEIARRVCAIGAGIFLLAATGQIHERRVAVHWRYAPALQEQYPDMHIDADSIFCQSGRLWTSVGLATSFDLALALIEADLGHALAIHVARHLVMFMKRSGRQSQASISLHAPASSDWTFAELHTWIYDHLDGDLSVARLAEKVCMTPRTFARKYTERLGHPPASTVEAMRLDAARSALENSDKPLKSIAEKVGLRNEQSLQRAFRRAFGITPADFRADHQRNERQIRIAALQAHERRE